MSQFESAVLKALLFTGNHELKKKFHLSKQTLSQRWSKIDPPGLDRASDPEPHNDRHTEVSRSRVATGQSTAEGSVLGLSKKSNHVQQ